MSKYNYSLDQNESDIAEAYAAGEFSPIGNLEEREKIWQSAVKETTKKRPINLRLQEGDIQKVKTMALEQGIPYQTLISSIIHRYVKGDLHTSS